MLYIEIIAVCSEIHTKHINTLCGQNVEFVNVKLGGTYSNHWIVVTTELLRVKHRPPVSVTPRTKSSSVPSFVYTAGIRRNVARA
jgi:hypothetical protein